MEIAKLKNYNPVDNTRLCKKCQKWLILTEFSTRIAKGKVNLQVREICKKCSLKSVNKDCIYTTPDYRRKLYEKHISKHLLNNAKIRAKLKGIDINITKEDIILPEYCPLLNIPIIISKNFLTDNSPNLDRIDNNKGYIKGNVWVISKKANTIKSNANIEELELLLNNLKKVLNKLG